MSIEESAIYIKTKLSSAGASSDIFTPQALRAIASYSSGNPRVISRVCDLALMIANKIDKSNIDEEVANLAINEINIWWFYFIEGMIYCPLFLASHFHLIWFLSLFNLILHLP